MARWEKSEKQKELGYLENIGKCLFWGATGFAGFKGFQVDGNDFEITLPVGGLIFRGVGGELPFLKSRVWKMVLSFWDTGYLQGLCSFYGVLPS